MLGYCIMRTEKRKKTDLGGLQKENNRTAATKSESFPNSVIDRTMTDENVFLVRSDNFLNSIRDEIETNAAGQTIRKDAVVCLDSLFTASPEFFDFIWERAEEHEKKTGIPAFKSYKEYCTSYFTDCLDFIEREYGHVINAVIHYDEKTPHMHVMHVPLIEKEVATGRKRKAGELPKREKQIRLSAKDVIGNKKKMSATQDKFHEQVGKKYHLERGEKNTPEIKRTHYSVVEYKARSILERTERFIKDINSDLSVLSSRRSTVSEITQARDKIVEKTIGLADNLGFELNIESAKKIVSKSHESVR